MKTKAAILSIGLLVISISLLVFLPILAGIAGVTGLPVGLTLTIICGVAALISVLVLSSYVLNALDLSDRDEALGLPTGSVRAIIALSLILIFAIMSIFMFQSMATPIETTSITITSNSTIGGVTITNSTTKTIQGDQQAMVDFSKQILTTLGTLVVAIAAFYFGTKSVQAAQGSKEKAELFIDPSETSTWIIGYDSPIKILMKPTPENAAVTWTVVGDEYKSVQRVSPNRIIYTPSVTEPKEVSLIFEMPAFSDVKPITLKVKILKPDLSIDPAEEREGKKNKSLIYEAKPTPKDAEVVCTADKGESVTEDKGSKNKFTYTPTIDEGVVTLTFKLSKVPSVKKELKVNVKK